MPRRSHLFPIGLAVLLLTGCMGGTSDRWKNACSEASPALVNQVMDHARAEYQEGDSLIARVQFEQAVHGPLPKELRRFGATELLVVQGLLKVKNPAGDLLKGVLMPEDWTFAVDADGRVIGQINAPEDRLPFDLPVPDEPGWEQWAAEVNDSPTHVSLVACVEPDLR